MIYRPSRAEATIHKLSVPLTSAQSYLPALAAFRLPALAGLVKHEGRLWGLAQLSSVAGDVNVRDVERRPIFLRNA